MYFTDEQLSEDPELRPRVWKSEETFQRERLFLLKQLATTLHAAADDPSSVTSSPSMVSSSSISLVSPTSTIMTVDSDKLSRSNSSIFSFRTVSSIASTPRSVSSFFSLPFGSTSKLSIASSASGYVPRTPIVFNSPQTSTFSFETANPSPLKVDSVMGSPIRFRSASIFKRKNKKIEKKDADQDSTPDVIKEGRVFEYLKTVVNKRNSKGPSIDATDIEKTIDNSDDNDKTIVDDSDDTETVKDFVRTESDSSLDSKGKEYVVDRLGLGTIHEPQPIEHQYRFVKKQIEKARAKFLGQKVVKSRL